MRTIIHSGLLAATLLGSASLMSCSDKNEEPLPADPAPSYNLSQYFDFSTPAPAGGTAHSGWGTIHPSQDITGTARLDVPGNVLVLNFRTTTNEVYMELDQRQLRPGWTGTYALRTQARPTDPAFVSYFYHTPGQSSIAMLRLSDLAPQLNGNVTITAYDARRQLVSGHFTIKAPNQYDPSEPANRQLCNISLDGDFTDLKVK